MNEFKSFLGVESITTGHITETVCKDFRNYLLRKFNGETPLNYFSQFKRVIKQATKEKYFKENPAIDVKSKTNPKKLREIIDIPDYRKMLNNECFGNPEIRRAALFSIYTAMRWTDVKSLTWTSIRKDYLLKKQDKTKAYVEIPLIEQAMEILGEHKQSGLVFDLPTADGANKTLVSWITGIGLGKHITWHCMRHSTAIILGDLSVPIQVIAQICGHQNLQSVMKTYSRGTKKEVRKAMKNLENALKSDEQQQTIAEKSEIDKQLELEKIRKDNLMLQIELAKLQQGINPLKVVR